MSIPTSQSLLESQKRVAELKATRLAQNIAQQNEIQEYRLAQALQYIDKRGYIWGIDRDKTPEEYREEEERLKKVLSPIPADCNMFFREYGYEWAQQIEWYWSITFGVWGCKVMFEDGYICCTYPQPAPLPEPTPEEKIELTKLGFYDQWGHSDLIAGATPTKKEEDR